MYNAITTQKPFNTPKNARTMPERTIKPYLSLFWLSAWVLNFNANIGISLTSRYEKMNIKRIKTGKAHVKDAKEAPKPVNNEAQNKAFAGVGSPIKEVV